MRKEINGVTANYI